MYFLKDNWLGSHGKNFQSIFTTKEMFMDNK